MSIEPLTLSAYPLKTRAAERKFIRCYKFNLHGQYKTAEVRGAKRVAGEHPEHQPSGPERGWKFTLTESTKG